VELQQENLKMMGRAPVFALPLIILLASCSALPLHPSVTNLDSVEYPQVSLISCAGSSDGDQGEQAMKCLQERVALNAATVPSFFIVATIAGSGTVVLPPMLGNASWVTFSDAASTAMGQTWVLGLLDARHGTMLNAIQVDIFPRDALLPGVLGAYFISEGRILLNLEAGKEVPEDTAALIASHLSPLLDMDATLGGAAAQGDVALAGAEPIALAPSAQGLGRPPPATRSCLFRSCEGLCSIFRALR
jgi:hypothetical protein